MKTRESDAPRVTPEQATISLWQAWAAEIGKLVGCTASSVPWGNEHITHAVAAAIARGQTGKKIE